MELEQDFFALFGLPREFSLDKKKLKIAARNLLLQYHPDKLVNATQHEKRLAEQFTAHVNHAAAILETNLDRAAHLLTLCGIDANFDNRTIKDGAFLMAQMSLRESLEDAQSRDDLQALSETVERDLSEICGYFESFDFQRTPDEDKTEQLLDSLAKMYFYEKFAADLKLQSKSLN